MTDKMTDLVGRAFKSASVAWRKSGFDLSALPPPVRVVHLIDQIDFEIALGGVLGWLINSSGKYGPDTAKAFEAVGAHQCAAIVREIMGFFPHGTLPPEEQERVQQILAVEEAARPHWRELGDRLLTWPDDIYVLLQKFIAEHEADFT